jgi:threonine dehydrogenase-like Zn-dependent dehydrogenase
VQALTVAPGSANTARLEEVPAPIPAAGEVLVRTLELGVCGTDREIIAGHVGRAPEGMQRMVLGHEVVGRVERDSDGFAAGELVAATVRRRCAICDGHCPPGSYDSCDGADPPERGVHGLDGFGSELFAEQPENLVRVPTALGRVGVLGEPMSICERGVRHAFAVGERQPWRPRRALVLGAGAIGALSTALLRLRGLDVFTLARGPAGSEKAAIVEQLDARYVSTADTTIADVAAEVQPDVVIEATGDGGVIQAAAAALGPNGVACILGVDQKAGVRTLDPRVLSVDYVVGNRALIGSVNAGERDWSAGIDSLGRVEQRWPGVLTQMIGLRVDPDAWADAVAYRGVKATISFAGKGS